MVEIFFNNKFKIYTLKLEISGFKSIKKIPLKFKLIDSTSKYRKEELKKQLLNIF